MGPLVVATFNIHHGRGRDGVVDLARSAAVITDAGPALVGLQELDAGLARSEHQDQPEALARLTGMSAHFVAAMTLGEGRYGIGLLVAPAIAAAGVEVTGVELTRLADEEPRVALIARLAGLTFITTHLSRSRRARAEQLAHVAGLAAAQPPPVVLAGDLNERARGLDELHKVGLRRVPAGRLGAPIDHIFVGPGARGAWARTIRTEASDHPLVVGGIEVGQRDR